MRFRLAALILCFCALFSITGYAAEWTPITDRYENIGIVQCPRYLNIRKAPKTSSDVVGIIQNEGVCEVMQVGQTWCAIKSGEITGYVLKEYLLLGDEASELAVSIADKKVKFKSAGVVYASMTREDKVWERPGKGTTYDVMSEYEGWFEIDLQGTSGYIPIDNNIECYMGLSEATHTYNITGVSKTRQDMVKYAMTFLGNPYVWGGNDPHTGADCSGFVRYIYNAYRPDIWLPRTSYTQCYYGERITSLDMRPGDLIFYAYDSGTVHHVAMYIGNGTIIHAASRRQGVILSPWNYKTPKYIRNMLGD